MARKRSGSSINLIVLHQQSLELMAALENDNDEQEREHSPEARGIFRRKLSRIVFSFPEAVIRFSTSPSSSLRSSAVVGVV